MGIGTFAMMIVAGVLAGWLAGFVMERGGYGLRWDIIFGLVGSVAGSGIFWGLRVSPGAGLALVASIAFVGAAIAIVTQRQIWPTTA